MSDAAFVGIMIMLLIIPLAYTVRDLQFRVKELETKK